MRVKFPTALQSLMVDHCRLCAPEEGCGVLLGPKDTDEFIVEQVVPITNTDQSETHFTLDVKEQLDVKKVAARNKKKVVAVFHSHPKGPSRLTKEDLRLAVNPDVLWVLVSNVSDDTPVVQAFSVTDNVSSEVEIVL